MTYQVERGIELPPKGKTGRRPRYPWHEMSVGDSFLIPKGKKSSGQISAAASDASKRYGTKYTQRTGPSGIRVWRIK